MFKKIQQIDFKQDIKYKARKPQVRHSFGPKKRPWFRLVCWAVLVAFCFNAVGQDVALAWSGEEQNTFLVPPGTLMKVSPAFSLPNLRAISIDSSDPFKINFLLDKADRANVKDQELRLLVKYFLTFLTMPEDSLWVNLSPYESDRIITPELETTPVGRDMLIQDYMLKQMSASLTYPEEDPGKSFWAKVYAKLQKEYGDINIPVDTFNKVWVVPEKAVVYERDGTAVIAESRLKVMLEEDYVSIEKNGNRVPAEKRMKMNQVSSKVARDVLIPVLEKEVNEGKNFAPLRQMFNSLILAIWWKKRLKQHLVSRVYVDQKKTSGIVLDDKRIKEEIYDQYLLSIKKGVYNLIREDYDDIGKKMVPRKYFSGGTDFGHWSGWYSSKVFTSSSPLLESLRGLFEELRFRLSVVTINLIPRGLTRKQLVNLVMATVIAGNSMSGLAVSADNQPGSLGVPAIEQPMPDGGDSPALGPRAQGVVPGTVMDQKAGFELKGEFSKEQSVAQQGLPETHAGTESLKPVARVELPEIQGQFLGLGDTVGEFLPYFNVMKALMGPEDVGKIDGKVNALSHRPYHITVHNFDSNKWEANFPTSSRDKVDIKLQTVIYAWQEKMSLRPDGVVGPGTLNSVRTEARKAGPQPVSEQKLARTETQIQAPEEAPAAAAAAHVPADQAAAVAPDIVLPSRDSGLLVKLGNVISPEDKGYFAALKVLLTPQDIAKLATMKVTLNSHTYDAEHWENNFPEPGQIANSYNLKARTMVMAWQVRMGLSSDGILGGDTRMSIRLALQKRGIVFAVQEVQSGQQVKQGPPAQQVQQQGHETQLVPAVGEAPAAVQEKDVPQPVAVAQTGAPSGQAALAAKSTPPGQGGIAQLPAANGPVIAAPENGKEAAAGPPPPEKQQEFHPILPYRIHAPIALVPVSESIISPASGIVEGVQPGKTEYAAGETQFTIVNPDLKKQEEELKQQLAIEAESLDRLEKTGKETGVVPIIDMTKARQSVAGLRQQLARVKQEQSRQIVRAPVAMSAQYMVSNGMHVTPGTVLVQYHTKDWIRFDVVVPLDVAYFGNVHNPAINGQAVQKIVHVDWSVEPSMEEARATFTVVPPEGRKFSGDMVFDAEFLLPAMDHGLESVRGESTLATVSHREEDVITAPAAGPVKYNVTPGDGVSVGQNVAEIDAGPYQEERVQAQRAHAALSAFLRNRNITALPRVEQDKYRKELATLKARMDELDTIIAKLRPVAPGHGLVSWTAALQTASVDQGGPLARISTAKVWVGDQGHRILLSREQEVKPDDGVVVETPSGIRLPGRVIVVDKNPKINNLDIHNFQALQVRVEDPGHVLWPGMRVSVIVPGSQQDQAIVQESLTHAEKVGAELRMDKKAGTLSAGSVTFNSYPGADLWVLMNSGAADGQKRGLLGSMEQVLTHDASPQVRTDTLRNFLETQYDQEQFLAAAERVILNSPYLDVVQQLLKYMVDRPDHDPRFFVRIIVRAENQQKPDVAQGAYQALRDILVNDPGSLKDLSEATLASGAGAEVTAEMGRKVFLTMLLREPEGSMARDRFLLSHYWTDRELKENYDSLLNYAEGLETDDPGYPFRQSIVQLAALIRDVYLRRQELNNLPNVFPKDSVYNSTVFFPEDMYRGWKNLVLPEEDKRVLLTSPEWRYLHLIPRSLRERGGVAVVNLFGDGVGDPRFAPQDSPIFLSLLDVPGDESFMRYFDQLGYQGEAEYIRDTRNFSELARILSVSTLWREAALDRLMLSPEGQLQALAAYRNSSDENLLQLVESRNWKDFVKSVARGLDNPASTEIFRQAMFKMHERTKETWLLDARLATFSWPELQDATDPRGVGAVFDQVDMVALEMALRYKVYERSNRTIFPSLNGYFNATEEALMGEIRTRLETANGPAEVEAYLQQLKRQMETGHKPGRHFLNSLLADRDRIAADIKENNQDIPLPPVSYIRLAQGGVLFMIGLFLSFLRQRHRSVLAKKHNGPDDWIQELRKDLMTNGERPGPNKDLHGNLLAALGKKGSSNGDYNHRGSLEQPVVSIDRVVAAWEEELRASQDLSGAFRAMARDMNAVLTHADEVIGMTAYIPDLILDEESEVIPNPAYWKALTGLEVSLINAERMLTQYVRIHGLPQGVAGTRFLLDADRLKEQIDYVGMYLFLLQSRTNLDKGLIEKLPDTDRREWLMYPLIRRIFGYRHRINKSREDIIAITSRLMEKGNRLLPGLYENPEAIQAETERLLALVIRDARRLLPVSTSQSSHDEIIGRFWRGVGRLAGPGLSVLVAVVGLVLAVPKMVGAASLLGLTMFLYNIYFHWYPNYKTAKMSWYQTLRERVDGLDKEFNVAVGRSLEQIEKDRAMVPQKRAVAVAGQEREEELAKELNPDGAPRVDAVVVIAQNPEDEKELKRCVREVQIRGGRSGDQLFREGVPVDVVSFVGPGQGNLNVYLKAVRQVGAQGRVLFVFYERNRVPVADSLRKAVMNGYVAAARMAEQKQRTEQGRRQEHILIYSRDDYDGPVEFLPDADVTLLGTRVKREQLKNFGMINTDFARTGNPRVREIFEKLSYENILSLDQASEHGSALYSFFDDKFDFDNPDLEQFPALVGFAMFNEDMVQMVNKLVDELDAKDLWHHLPYLNLTIDMFKILKLRKSELKDYARSRLSWDNAVIGMSELKPKKYTLFYDLVLAAQQSLGLGGTLKEQVFLPYSASAKLEQIRGERNHASVSWEPPASIPVAVSSFPLVENASQPGTQEKPPGGVDLSKTEKRTEFRELNAPLPMDAAFPADNLGPLPPLDSFQGFDFQILPVSPPLVGPVGFLIGLAGEDDKKSSVDVVKRQEIPTPYF